MSSGMNWQRWKKKKTGKSSPPSCGTMQPSSTATSCLPQDDVEFASTSASTAACSSPTSSSYNLEKPPRDSVIPKKRKKKNKSREGPLSSNTPSMQTYSLSRKNEHRTGDNSSDTTMETHPENLTSMHHVTPKKKHPELPGFYYDEEKRRYFRILPGHASGNVVTTETIRQKEAEKKRQSFFSNEDPCHSKEMERVNPKPDRGSLTQLTAHRQRGECRSRNFQRQARENVVQCIRLKPRCLVTPFPDRYFDGESGYISHLELDDKQKQVLMVISDDYLSRLWQGEVKSTRNPLSGKEEATITSWTTVNILTTRNCKVTHASWAQVKDGENMYALYAISGGTTSSVQLFKCPSGEDGVSHMSYRYESNHEMAWTCAWSNTPSLPAHLAIGSTRKAIVVDTISASKQKLHTCHSDVFAQIFSRKSPVLYNGTRRGEVLGVDLRIPSHSHVDMTAVLRHSVSVCSLKLLRDENYLLVGDMRGGIKLWDVRKCAIVQEFKGHHNESHHLPVNVDSTESIVHAVGQDKYTRLWSLQTGNLLSTIPCPSSCQEDNAPCAIFSQDFGRPARPGLFVGQERQIHWYSMR